jgi:glycosyltransferase involved in cell wall biosynthesis
MAYYQENPNELSKADVVVGIPSFNEAESIGHTTEQVAKGLVEFFGHLNSVIINCDNNSTDGTKEAFFKVSTEVPKIYLSTAPGVRGKGNNLRNLFERVRELQAKVVVVVEADIKNLAPYWIRNLGEPVLRGVGYVSPLYVRHKYEATLTSSIVYPLTRCLYGRRVRQPIAGDCGFSGALADEFLKSPFWTEAAGYSGIDIWMTTTAMNARVPISQALMGCPKVHRVKDPYAQLAVLFRQVLSSIYDLMAGYENFWRQVKWSKPTALFGVDIQETETPLPVEINLNRLHERYLQGCNDYAELWQRIFDQTVFHKLQEIRSLGLQHFSIPSQTWARILFDSAIVYHRMEESERSTLFDALLPLYLGKVLSFVKRTERMSLQQAEEHVENECTVFEENKPYLVSEWK